MNPIRPVATLTSLLAALLQTGCVGLGVYVVGDVEFASTPTGDNYVPSLAVTWTDRAHVLGERGVPDDTFRTSADCEVLEFDAGLSWSGVVPFLVVVPIPLIVPTGGQSERFYLVDGKVVARTVEKFDVLGGLAYGCGSNSCEPLFGRVTGTRSQELLREIEKRCGGAATPHNKPLNLTGRSRS